MTRQEPLEYKLFLISFIGEALYIIQEQIYEKIIYLSFGSQNNDETN